MHTNEFDHYSDTGLNNLFVKYYRKDNQIHKQTLLINEIFKRISKSLQRNDENALALALDNIFTIRIKQQKESNDGKA